jgi:hypothetical protein
VVEISLSGDGLWDWIEANMDAFKSAFRQDVVTILSLDDPSKVTDISARKGAAALLLLAAQVSGQSTRLLADAQNVDVSFTMQAGASNALAPMDLAKKFEYAFGNGTARFSQMENVSGVSINGTYKGTTAQIINPVTLIILLFVLLPCCCVCCIAYAVYSLMYKSAKGSPEMKPANEIEFDQKANPIATIMDALDGADQENAVKLEEGKPHGGRTSVSVMA